MVFRASAIVLVAALASGCSITPRPTSNLNSPVDPSSFVFPDDSQWDSPPVLVSGNNAVYPISLVLAGIQGNAVLEFTIDTDGEAKDISIESATDRGFADHAILALKDWKFKPATKNGVPVEARVTRTFTFRSR